MSPEPVPPASRRVDPETLPYRPCVGIVLLNAEGLVWTGRRLVVPSGEMEGALQLWQMPQGGIDAGEAPEPAARRELREETGVSSVSLLAEAPDWITYELPPELVGIALKGRYRGQRQRWFAYRFEGAESEIAIDPPPGGHAAEFDSYAWKPMREVVALVVPFKRGVYEAVAEAFAPLLGGR